MNVYECNPSGFFIVLLLMLLRLGVTIGIGVMIYYFLKKIIKRKI